MVKILLGQIRYDKHISLRKLAAYTGFSRTYINNIENNMTYPKIDALCAIARALQVPVTDLFEDTRGIKA
jgi:transcriptional regulator with XRE-family HTH domain